MAALTGSQALWGVSLTLHMATLLLVATLWRQAATPSAFPSSHWQPEAAAHGRRLQVRAGLKGPFARRGPYGAMAAATRFSLDCKGK